MRIFAPAALLFSLPAFLAAQCSSVCSTGAYGPAQGASGLAQYVVCMPQPASCYNGNMILFAHGYVAPGSPANAWLSQLALPDGTALPGLLNGLGFGFAASSFSKEGLAILQGVQDTKALINVIEAPPTPIPVQKYFVTGASEGGLIAAKSVEEYPASYAGGLPVCGPLGSFRKQINYFDDVRVLFDYFFPGVLPGTAINIPANLIANWATVYEPAVIAAVTSYPLATLQLINTAQIEIGLNPANAPAAIAGVLWYNVFATTDAEVTLGNGNPANGNAYDNTATVYRGSFNDVRLNALVERDSASSVALNNLASYETAGLLRDPLVTLHTLADPIVPFWQEPLYAAKVAAAGSLSKLVEIPAPAYGHCNVTAAEAEGALSLLLLEAGH
jgi:hypothetical protein